MPTPKIALIGGSGLAAALTAGTTAATRHEVETPFGRPSDAILETTWHGLPLLILSRHGPGHIRNPSQVPYRANIFALKQLGATHILASGAVGSLREELRPRQLVVVDQAIDKTTRRATTFYDQAAVHVEMAEPFCPVLRQILVEAGQEMKSQQVVVHDRGCYVVMEGPGFSTRAESLMHRLWGGDLIGMTAMPEARLAKEAEIPYALVALVTDYDCWKPHASGADARALVSEIIGHLEAASVNAIDLMRRAVEKIATDRARVDGCPAARALEQAIWSDKGRIPAEEVERLRPLWGRYFPVRQGAGAGGPTAGEAGEVAPPPPTS